MRKSKLICKVRHLLTGENDTPISKENIDVVSFYRTDSKFGPGSMLYRSTVRPYEYGMARFYASPDLNILDYQNAEKNEEKQRFVYDYLFHNTLVSAEIKTWRTNF